MPLHEDDPRPAYIQIADDLRKRLKQGAFQTSKKLPSIKKIAEEFQVAPMTAQKASQVLEAEGLVVRRPGTGFIVRSTPSDSPQAENASLTHKLESMEAQLKHVISRLDRLEKTVSKLQKEQ